VLNRRHVKEEQVIRVIVESALSTASTKEIKMINTLAESTLSTPIWLYIVTRSGGLWEFSSKQYKCKIVSTF
jgi:hypothetical protein